MRVTLLGTGSADGWPNPWCRCASCDWARRAGVVRAHTAVLVDDRLLIDCGPDAARQADRAGSGLGGVEAVLLTHAHWDHADPAALLTRSWTDRPAPLTVAGPAGALARFSGWHASGTDAGAAQGREDGDDGAGGVEQVPLVPGASLALGPYQVRALAAGHHGDRPPWRDDPLAREALLYDLTDEHGTRVLYATDTGPPPAATLQAVAGHEYDLVLLDETFGHLHDHGTGHLDLRTFSATVAELRRVGAVTARTDVVAVHLSHHNPPGPELTARLADWGARTVPDLTTLHLGDECGTAPVETDECHIHRDRARRELVLGGARSGKSALAESRLAAEPAVTYVAPGGGRTGDADWAARVAAHRARRPAHWRTEETAEIAALLREADPDHVLLVDCLALWLATAMEAAGCWDDDVADTEPAETVPAETEVERRVRELVAAVRTTRARVVLVSNEVGSGVVPAYASGRRYRDRLGDLNARIGRECDAVTLVVAGQALALRGAGA